MQESLFPDPVEPPALPAAPTQKAHRRPKAQQIEAAQPSPALLALAQHMPPGLRLGTSSWSYPGWNQLLWDGDYDASLLSRHGLSAYAKHPLLQAVCIDRGFYRALTTAEFARYAAQVPSDFRFVVKAPSAITDAQVRADSGRGMEPNPLFLNPELAVQDFVQPALDGLGDTLGVLLFQLSPLPLHWLTRLPEVFQRLDQLLTAVSRMVENKASAQVAVEVRDPELITPQLAAILRHRQARYCLGLHPKLPPIEQQLPILRALWPAPLICRWNLHAKHGPYGYQDAETAYQPYSRLIDPDIPTRTTLARVIQGTLRGGQTATVIISNHAEGSAPCSVEALLQAIQLPP